MTKLLTYIFQHLSGINAPFDLNTLIIDNNPFEDENRRIQDETIDDDVFYNYLVGDRNFDWFKRFFGWTFDTQEKRDALLKLLNKEKPD